MVSGRVGDDPAQVELLVELQHIRLEQLGRLLVLVGREPLVDREDLVLAGQEPFPAHLVVVAQNDVKAAEVLGKGAGVDESAPRARRRR